MFSVSSHVSCVHRDSQSPAPLHPGSTPTLRAYWLTDADESFGIERHFMILSLQVRFVTSSSLKKLFIIIIVCVIHAPFETGSKMYLSCSSAARPGSASHASRTIC